MKWTSLRRLVFLFIAIVFVVTEGFGQGNIYTDRPTQTTSSAIVPIGTFQIETGFYLSEFYDPNGPNSKYQFFSLNNTLLRYGISDRIELRLYQELVKDRLQIDGTTAFSNEISVAPTLIGAKFNLVKNNPDLPDMGVIVSTGGGVFEETGNGLQTDLRFAIDGNLSSDLTLSSNLGVGLSNGFDNGTPFYTLVLGYGLDEKVSIFIESYGSFPSQGGSQHAMDAGLTYLINSSLQFDVYGGTGISNNSANLLLGFGLSKRFLKN